MTKAKYPRDLRSVSPQSLADNLKDFSSTLDSWTNAREDNFQAQMQLLQSCKDDEEVKRYKAMGLLNFDSSVF
jgi:hypothetical protein